MQYSSTLTTCPYCGCGCNFFLEVIQDRITGPIPCKTSPVNQGSLCIKGWNVHHFIQHESRLKSPLIRKNGELVETGWEEALDYTASRLGEIKAKYGPQSLAFLASAKVTNEENYLLQKLARGGLGTNNIDHCARL